MLFLNMVSMARKNLFHDKIRFIITLIGVTFSVVLIFAQVGVYLGFMRNASMIIDKSGVDIWITSRDTPNFEWARSFPERKINTVRGTEGVEFAEKLIFAWGMMKLKDGGTEQIEIIGYNPNSGIGAPWKMKKGNIKDVKGGMYIIVDESAEKRLGRLEIGYEREIMDKRVKVIGIAEGVRSITTAPFVFASFETARELASYIGRDNITYILAKVKPGYKHEEVVQKLSQRIPELSVYTGHDFSFRTRKYWTIETGMGMGFLITALLGFAIGMVIVGQTIYTSTIEHLREYGTLKAMGARNSFIYRIIFEQALINAFLGYIVGLIALKFLIKGYEKTGLDMVVTPLLAVFVLVITVMMCIFASFISIRKATKIDPVMVFRA
ncbi:MAG: ABC transporter permease [Nitrospirota bacterium]